MTEQPWTPEADEKLRAYLARPGYKIPIGIGTEEAACSMAAINLALTGELTEDVPPCMSEVVGEWIMVVQDSMPADIRDSPEWRALLPLAAGTGRDKEQERLAIILDWMWETVLPYFQPITDVVGYGTAWRTMCMARTEEAANTAREAASEAARATDNAAIAESAARAAKAAGYAPHDAPHDAARAAWGASRAAGEVAYAAAWATYAANAATSAAAWATGYSAWLAGYAAAWEEYDPVGVLRKLVDVH